jgi:hypothetical protein
VLACRWANCSSAILLLATGYSYSASMQLADGSCASLLVADGCSAVLVWHASLLTVLPSGWPQAGRI